MSSITNSPLFTAGVLGMAGTAAIECARAMESTIGTSISEYLPSQEINGIALIASTAVVVFGIAHSLLRGPTVTKDKEVVEPQAALPAKVENNEEAVPVVERRGRNVVLLGRTRTGKTVIREGLKNPLHLPPPSNLWSSTRAPEVATLDMGNQQVDILDTPGVGDLVEIKGKQLTDEQILEANDQAVIANFGGYDKVDRVFLTMRFPVGRLDHKEIDSVRKCVEHIKSKGVKKITLVLTHSEEYDAKYAEERFRAARTAVDATGDKKFDKLIKDFFEDGTEVILSGALYNNQSSDWELLSDQQISTTLSRVLDLRKKVIEKIFGKAEEQTVWNFLNSNAFDVENTLDQMAKHIIPEPKLDKTEESIEQAHHADFIKRSPLEDRERLTIALKEQIQERNEERRISNQTLLDEHKQKIDDFKAMRRPLFEAWAKGELPGAPNRQLVQAAVGTNNDNNAQNG